MRTHLHLLLFADPTCKSIQIPIELAQFRTPVDLPQSIRHRLAPQVADSIPLYLPRYLRSDPLTLKSRVGRLTTRFLNPTTREEAVE